MNHSEIEELLSAHEDGELTPAQQEMVDLHLAGCADCQRTLAEFRLTRQQLALLVDPVIATTWQPNVVQHVTARIRRRRRWLGLGRRLTLDAARALAVGLIVAAAVWLLPRLDLSSDDAMSGAAPSPPARQPTLVSPEPTNATDITLAAPVNGIGFVIMSGDLNGSFAPDAVQNLGFQLTLDEKTQAKDVFIVLERPDGAQVFLDPAQAPLIPVPAGVRAGDTLRLFLWLRGGEHSPVVEFALIQHADQGWLAVNPRKIDATPSLKVALPPPSTLSSTKLTLSVPRRGIAFSLISGADPSFETLDAGDVLNTVHMSKDGYEDTPNEDIFLVVERPDGTQHTFVGRELSQAMRGERLSMFVWLRGGEHSPVVEFTLDHDADGHWLFLDPRELDAPSVQVAPSLLETPQSTFMALQAPDDLFALYIFDADAMQDVPASDAVRNLGYRVSAPGLFVIVEIVGGEQIILDPAQAPSIHLPPGAQAGDQVRLFATKNVATSAAEFSLASTKEGWLALDLRQSPAPAELRVNLPTPAPQLVDASSAEMTSFSVAEGPEVVLRMERIYVTPEQPIQGQPFTITAVIRNVGDVDAETFVWFGALRRSQDPYHEVTGFANPVTILAGKEVQLNWAGKDQWERINSRDLSRETSRLIFRAGVNVILPGGLYYTLLPEAERLDNIAEITVDFLPYQPRVSDACPPGDNLWLEPGQAQINHSSPWQKALHVVVHNDGNVEVERVPLRTIDAEGRRFFAYARWVQPCGGTAKENVALSASQFTYPVTVTLNPSDAPNALPESDHSDNVVVVSAGEICTGTTDLWLTADDVAFEGDDLLVTMHLSGSPPSRSFWLRVHHSADGSEVASRQISGMTAWPCDEPKTMRFEGALAGLSGGVLMVGIDTESSRIESVYPQNNNTASVPLP